MGGGWKPSSIARLQTRPVRGLRRAGSFSSQIRRRRATRYIAGSGSISLKLGVFRVENVSNQIALVGLSSTRKFQV